jgi:PBP1b-binding outer membrane lipoprotein LpoB
MKQHAHLLILTIMFLTSCSDDTEVMKQESSPPSLVKKTRLIVTSVYSLLSIY